MKETRVKRMQDGDCHWYWIPEGMADQFRSDNDALPKLNPDDETTYNALGEFEIKYDQYRTGGAPEVVPAAFEGVENVVEVMV